MKIFIINGVCAFFISVLVVVFTAEKQKITVFYYLNYDEPRREITREMYIDAANKRVSHVAKEEKEVYKYGQAIINGVIGFAGMMILLSFIERFKNKRDKFSLKEIKEFMISSYGMAISIFYFAMVIALIICFLIGFYELAGWLGIVCLILFLIFNLYVNLKSNRKTG